MCDVGRAQDAGQPGSLQRCQLIGPLPKVRARRRSGPAQSRPPVDRVEVKLEDAVFTKRALHLGRIEQFAQLARDGPFPAGKKRARELLRQRARPALRAILIEIGQQQGHLGFVDAGVLAEALVLGHDHGRRQKGPHPVERHPAHLAIAGDDATCDAVRLRACHVEPTELQGFGAEATNLESDYAEGDRAATARQVKYALGL